MIDRLFVHLHKQAHDQLRIYHNWTNPITSTMESSYKYVAFISYSHKDESRAKWLQSFLEGYKMPTTDSLPILEEQYKSLRPIFRDTSELSSGILNDEIERALSLSRYLIVICSPNSAKSQWVNKEVEYFVKSGRTTNIIPFIVDGEPGDNESNCFPPALISLPKEILGISMNEMGREAAAIKTISYMLGVSFDSLWHRFERNLHRRRRLFYGISTAVSILAISVAAYIWHQNGELRRRDWGLLVQRNRIVAEKADLLIDEGNSALASFIACQLLPIGEELHKKPFSPELERALRKAYYTPKSTLLRSNCKSVASVSFSPDDKTLAVASDDGIIRLWDVNSGSLKQTLVGHEDRVNSVRFNSDGTKLVSASYDETVIVWDLETGRPISHMLGHENIVTRAFFSLSDSLVISISWDGRCIKWDAESGDSLGVLIDYNKIAENTADKNAETIPTMTAVSDDGSRFALLLLKGTLILFDVNLEKIAIRDYSLFHRNIDDLFFDSENERLLVYSHNNEVLLSLDLITGRYTIHDDWPSASVSRPHSYILTSTSNNRDSVVVIYPNGRSVYFIPPVKSAISTTKLSHDNSILAIGSQDMDVRLYSMNSQTHSSSKQLTITPPSESFISEYQRQKKEERKIIKSQNIDPKPAYNKISSIMINQSKLLAVATALYDHRLQSWNLESLDEIYHIDYIDNGEYVLNPTDEYDYNFFLRKNKDTLYGRKLSSNYLSLCTSFHPDGEHFLVFDSHGHLYERSAIDSCIVRKFDSIGSINKASYCPDGTVIAAIGTEQTDVPSHRITDSLLFFVNRQTSDIISSFPLGIKNNLSSFAFSPDGKTIAFINVSDDTDFSLIGLINLTTGTITYPWEGINDYIKDFYFFDNNTILELSIHGVIRFLKLRDNSVTEPWDLHTGTLILGVATINNDYIISYARPFGQHIGNDDWNNVIVWHTASHVPVQEFHVDNPISAFFSENDDKVLVISEDGRLISFDFPPIDKLITMERERFSGREFTEEEKKQYYLE